MATRFPRRLAVLATALSTLLVVGVLFSAPAFAWSINLDVYTDCPDGQEDAGQTRVNLSADLHDTAGDSGRLEVSYKINGGAKQDLPPIAINKGDKVVSHDFLVPSPDDKDSKIYVSATAYFDHSDHKPSDMTKVKLAKCKGDTTTTTEAPTTTAPPSTAAPTTTEAPTTTAGGGGGGGVETTTSAPAEQQDNLPFTGANSVPMMVAALLLVVGGGGILFATRFRGRHARS